LFFEIMESNPSATEQNHRGQCLEYGIGISVNPSEAAKYYKLSADQGNSSGQCDYACCLQSGIGVSMNPSEAAKYYKLSADQGNSSGQCNYALPSGCHPAWLGGMVERSRCPAFSRLRKCELEAGSSKQAEPAAEPYCFADDFGLEVIIDAYVPEDEAQPSVQSFIEIQRPPPVAGIEKTRLYSAFAEFVRFLTE
jgi:TPR repeat protein